MLFIISWEIMPSLRFPRCFASAAVCKQNLYVLGGAWLDAEMDCGNFSSVYDVDIYNPVNNCWEGITALRMGRHDAGLAVLGSPQTIRQNTRGQAVSYKFTRFFFTGPRIYIVGGKHCEDGAIKNLDSVECFDVERDDWIDGVTPLPLSLLGPSITYTC